MKSLFGVLMISSSMFKISYEESGIEIRNKALSQAHDICAEHADRGFLVVGGDNYEEASNYTVTIKCNE